MILIASHSKDDAVIQPVVDILQKKGKKTVIYYADVVAKGGVRASLMLDNQARSTFIYGDLSFAPEEIEAAWYRRPNIFGPEELNKPLLIYMDKERKACQDSLWYSIPPERWLSAPTILESYKHDKLEQLRLAQKAGFAIPSTVISNSWDDAYHSFQSSKVIIKLPNGRLYVEEKAHFLTCTIIDHEKFVKLSKTLPFPGIWQEYIPKKREWRVNVIGERVFSAAIYTAKKAKDDWRRHQFDEGSVKFKDQKLPQKIAEQCVALLKIIGTRFGAFDLIEKQDGTFVFLEVNLNGSYHWLVNALDQRIPEAIADELITIASNAQ